MTRETEHWLLNLAEPGRGSTYQCPKHVRALLVEAGAVVVQGGRLTITKVGETLAAEVHKRWRAESIGARSARITAKITVRRRKIDLAGRTAEEQEDLVLRWALAVLVNARHAVGHDDPFIDPRRLRKRFKLDGGDPWTVVERLIARGAVLDFGESGVVHHRGRRDVRGLG